MNIRAIIINVLLGGVFLLPSFSLAQNVKEDILRIKAAYEEIESFDSEVHHTLYATYEDTIPVETLKGRMKKSGNYSYSNLGDMETFNHKDYSLMVSHDDKLILIQPPMESPIENGFTIPLDSLEKFCEKIEAKDLDRQTRSHCYYFQEFTYRKVEMVFDAETYLVKKITLFMGQPRDLLSEGEPIQGRLEMEFRNFRVNPNLSLNEFSGYKYVKKTGGKIALNSTYQSYQLFNNLPQN